MSRKSVVIVLVGFIVLCMSVSGIVPVAQEQNGGEASLEERLAENKEAIQNLFGEIEGITQDLARQTTVNKDDLDQLEDKVKQLDRAFEELHNQVKEQSEYMKSLEGVEQYKNKILELAEDISSLSRQVERNTSRVKKHEESYSQVQRIATDLEEIVSSNKNRTQENRARVKELEGRVDSLQDELEASSRRNLIIGMAGAALGAAALIMVVQ